jgi:PadR family transcriptional regulator PadR
MQWMARTPNSSPQTQRLLLAMARDREAWRHGYELSRQTGLKSGTLYPLLIRLSDQGLLEARWQAPERPGRPARHVYRLTSAGVALARRAASKPAFAASAAPLLRPV